MEVYYPSQFIMTNTIICDITPSKWEKRRDKLVQKVKRRKAFINWCLKYVCLIPICLITASLWIMLLSKMQSQINAVLIGIIIPMTWIIASYMLDGFFETDSSFIHFKRKGRRY